MRFTSVDLPTFGLPTTATTGAGTSILAGFSGDWRPTDFDDVTLSASVGSSQPAPTVVPAVTLRLLGPGQRDGDARLSGQVGAAPSRPHGLAGGQEHLDLGLGGDHGADVAALSHDSLAGREGPDDDLPLHRDQVRPDLRHGRHRADRVGYLASPDRASDIGPAHPDRRSARIGADLDLRAPQVLRHGRGMTLTNGNALAGRLAKSAVAVLAGA